MPMALFGNTEFGNPAIRIYWGETGYNTAFFRTWTTADTGSGVGRIQFDYIEGVEACSNKSVVILEGAPEYSVEKWDISDLPTYTGFSASGRGDANNRFNNPVDVTVDPDDYVYVLDILSNGQPRIKVFDPQLNSLGGVGDSTSISGTPIAIDWDDLHNSAHVLHTGGVAVFYK